jgi:antitoxin (DNA-binding transcriptional repressor) of toxin-antitoxin stability system
MKSTISATQAARAFSDLVNRVRYRGEEFVIERGGQPVCRIVPAGPPTCTVAELARILRSLPRPDDGYLAAVEEAVARQPALPRSPWRR